MKRSHSSRASATVVAIFLLFLPSLVAQTPAPQKIECNVVYVRGTMNPDGSLAQVAAHVSITPAELAALPATPAPIEAPVGAKGLKMPAAANFHGIVSFSDQGLNGPETITYDGDFSSLIAGQRYQPVGEVVIMKPQLGVTSPGVYSAVLPDLHLRATWSPPVAKDAGSDVAKTYFAVAVQVYRRQHSLQQATFTGLESIEGKIAGPSSGWTNSGPGWNASAAASSGGSWGSKMQTSGQSVALKEMPWVDEDVYAVKCTPVKMTE